jgi:hypothetical protein
LYPATPEVTCPVTTGSVEATHERLICDEEATVVATFVGTDGGVVSGAASVVAVTGFDSAELVPAASYAETVNE